jgi:3-hydroxyacyl-CoA dehydrogenase/enoyl-CoA hydratase/3-hydroxybutyryl-CoA epimerase
MSRTMIDTQLDADGVLLARIDMPGRAMNVFSRELMDELEQLMARAAEDSAVKAVVLTSGKAAFLAGADLEMIRMFTERARTGATEELHDLFGHLGRIFRRLELQPKPFVAAINGLALGGGLEVSMACQGRVVADDPAIQLGLPEVKLGLLPGAGGTQRLPRLVGITNGLRLLLTGEPVSPQEALRLGLVDEVVPADRLLEAARRRALALAAQQPHGQAPWDREGARFDSAPFDFSTASVYPAIAGAMGISDYHMLHYPAYRAIMQCVVGAWDMPMTMACEHEQCVFVKLMRDPVAGNMVRTLFLNKHKAAKLGLLGKDSPYSAGPDSLLHRLGAARDQARGLNCDEPETLLAQALVALELWDQGGVEQPELADAAAVAAGLYPSYTGGPYTFLVQTGADRLRALATAAMQKDSRLFAVPAALDRFFHPVSTIAA